MQVPARVLIAAAVGVLALTACTERYREFQSSQTPTLRPPVEAYTRTALLAEAQRMQRAQHPYQWNRMLFHLGVCYRGEIEQLPKATYRETITTACAMLGQTQREFAYQCESDEGCNIGPDAKAAIQKAVDLLDAAAPDWSQDEAGNTYVPE